jgi:DNA-binding phage protein
MQKTGLSESFIVNAVRYALEFEGIAELMKLWHQENEQQEKDEIIADIQDMIDACQQKEKSEEFYVKFSDLDVIAHHIRDFKDSLLAVVVEKGGIGHLSALTGIPQSSLSRFFNSNAMPQRATLFKIAKALDLEAVKMNRGWGLN